VDKSQKSIDGLAADMKTVQAVAESMHIDSELDRYLPRDGSINAIPIKVIMTTNSVSLPRFSLLGRVK
jgi:hypothetical protein